MNECSNEGCNLGYYPNYGIAPHDHDLSRGTFIGSTVMKSRKDWPPNFIEDPAEPGMGTYVCPECGK